jgi:hypothetical protein
MTILLVFDSNSVLSLQQKTKDRPGAGLGFFVCRVESNGRKRAGLSQRER